MLYKKIIKQVRFNKSVLSSVIKTQFISNRHKKFFICSEEFKRMNLWS